MMSFPAAAVDSIASGTKPLPAIASAIQPNPLLTIDQNRTTVVDHVVAAWGDALVSSGAGLTKDQLQALLTGLRTIGPNGGQLVPDTITDIALEDGASGWATAGSGIYRLENNAWRRFSGADSVTFLRAISLANQDVQYIVGSETEREHFGEGVAGAGEQLLGVCRVHRHRQLLPRRIVERGIGERHRRL
jgi:hypothetical protein